MAEVISVIKYLFTAAAGAVTALGSLYLYTSVYSAQPPPVAGRCACSSPPLEVGAGGACMHCGSWACSRDADRDEGGPIA